AIKQSLAGINPPDAWLDALVEAENASKKPRKGLLDAIDDKRRQLAQLERAGDDRIKLLSVTPEYCRIVAIGWAVGDGLAEVVMGDDERSILQRFMDVLAAHEGPICG